MEPTRLSPAQFFALGLDDGHMSAAQYETRISYSTICDAKRGVPVSVPVARKLEDWSKAVPAAAALGVCIGAVVAVGLAPAPTKFPRRVASVLAKSVAVRAA